MATSKCCCDINRSWHLKPFLGHIFWASFVWWVQEWAPNFHQRADGWQGLSCSINTHKLLRAQCSCSALPHMLLSFAAVFCCNMDGVLFRDLSNLSTIWFSVCSVEEMTNSTKMTFWKQQLQCRKRVFSFNLLANVDLALARDNELLSWSLQTDSRQTGSVKIKRCSSILFAILENFAHCAINLLPKTLSMS